VTALYFVMVFEADIEFLIMSLGDLFMDGH